MTIILVCILIFVVILASGLFGLFVQHRLPEAQKSESARVVIAQISGVLSLLLSLVLGTLVGSSFAFQTTQKTELDALAAQVLELDQTLGELGPTGAFARALHCAQGFLADYWSVGGGGGTSAPGPPGPP